MPRTSWVGARLPCRGQEAPQRTLKPMSHVRRGTVNLDFGTSCARRLAATVAGGTIVRVTDSLSILRAQVCDANIALSRSGLAKFTFGNASGIDRDRGAEQPFGARQVPACPMREGEDLDRVERRRIPRPRFAGQPFGLGLASGPKGGAGSRDQVGKGRGHGIG